MNLHKALALLLAGMLPVILTGCWSHDFDGGGMASVNAGSDEVNISKMGGGIDVANAPHGATLTTMGGDIHLGSVASFAKVKTMGGNVTIDHSTGSVDAATMGGIIKIGEANGPITASTMGGDVTVRMVGASSSQRDIDLSSKGGTITLVVPKDFPMDVRITLTHTKNAPREYEIVDHNLLQQQETPDWDTSHGTPRKTIRAAGKVGSGSNHVVIDTINGDVILKQE